MEPKIDEHEAVELMMMVTNIARLALMIPAVDVDAYLRELSYTDTVMPLVDPTAYREVMHNIPEHRKMMQVFKTFRAELESMRPLEAVEDD